MHRVLCGAALAAALSGLAGCGDSGPKLVPVSGVVTIDGQPLTYGHIQVAPTGWRAASSRIGSDGKFTLTTTVSGDGVVAGTHPVVVLAAEALSPEKTKWHAPKKYAEFNTANLTLTVTGPTDDAKIELKWDKGGKPFVETLAKEGGSENAGSR
jgi:predicted small lipoprotein YifL